nr:protein kinase domain-containing protein [Tanacetum cinerariifolium]
MAVINEAPFLRDDFTVRCKNRKTFDTGDSSLSAGAAMILIIITMCIKKKYGWAIKAEYNVNVEIFLKNQEFLAPKRLDLFR